MTYDDYEDDDYEEEEEYETIEAKVTVIEYCCTGNNEVLANPENYDEAHCKYCSLNKMCKPISRNQRLYENQSLCIEQIFKEIRPSCNKCNEKANLDYGGHEYVCPSCGKNLGEVGKKAPEDSE